MLKRLILISFVVLISSAATAASDYTKASLPNMVRTLVRFNAINLNDNRLLDEYAIITECSLYKALYKDDFKWNKVRTAIRNSIRDNVGTYPTAYNYDTQLQLDRYDFEAKLFRFTEKTVLKSINALVIYQIEAVTCGSGAVTHIPRTFRAVLDTPVYFPGLPLAPKDAEAILKQMETDKNIDRIVTATFNFHIIYIEPLHKNIRSRDNPESDTYSQSNAPDNLSLRMDAHLDSIDFYQDAAKTKLIYRYEP